MLARYVLATLSVVFLIAALRAASRHGRHHPQVQTWLLVAGIFTLVSGWLFTVG